MRRYLLYFAVPVAIVLGSSAFLSLEFEPIEGDLTRIGGYAEKDYGWNSTQPATSIQGNGKSITAPDILVLGDSFSRSNVWQSALAARLNTAILSFQFDQVGCIDNWIAYALNQPSSRSIVIEAVERTFVERFRSLLTCQNEIPLPFEMAPATSPATRAIWPPEWHIRHTFRTALNILKLDLGKQASMRGEVINVPIDSRCAKFSNRRNDRMLYYAEDEGKFRWDRQEQARAVANVMRIQELFAQHGKEFVFVIVPDKLSVYQDCIVSDAHPAAKRVNVTRALIDAGAHTPDLLGAFQEQAGRIVDLYLPDNTHLSETGYLFMAKKLEQFLAKNRPLPQPIDKPQ